MDKSILYSLFATFLWGAWAIGAKFASDRIGFFSSSLIYVMFSFLTVLTAFTISGTGIPRVTASGTLVAAASGVAGGIALICFQAAIQSGKLSIVVPITGLYPVIPAVYGIIILNEEFTPVRAVGVILAIVATILLSI